MDQHTQTMTEELPLTQLQMPVEESEESPGLHCSESRKTRRSQQKSRRSQQKTTRQLIFHKDGHSLRCQMLQVVVEVEKALLQQVVETQLQMKLVVQEIQEEGMAG